MHPADCPNWEYKHHQYASSVGLRCEFILDRLKKGQIAIDATLVDTRALHLELFVGLTPPDCDYYAGTYRGNKKCKCLRHMVVGLVGPGADMRVGVSPARVSADLDNLNSGIIPQGLAALDALFAKPDEEVAPVDKLLALVAFSCAVLVEFLRIHPYANGNGHIGRLIVWLLLWRHGYWPQKWPLDGHPPYDDLLSQYRDGDRSGLEKFVLNAINGT
jgi:hypothetical protein